MAWLRDSICAAIRDADLILLDTDSGGYGCIPGVGALLRLGPDGAVATGDPALVSALTELGVLGAERSRNRTPPPPLPRRDLGGELRAPADAGAILTLLGSAWDLVGGYWVAGFPDLVRRARVRQAAPLRRAGEATLRRHALQFRELLPWVPFQGQCLFRSVMLQAYLRRRGLASTLVFGCQTWPFEAHCWVQCGDLVLDDGVDHVAGFTPLMAI